MLILHKSIVNVALFFTLPLNQLFIADTFFPRILIPNKERIKIDMTILSCRWFFYFQE